MQSLEQIVKRNFEAEVNHLKANPDWKVADIISDMLDRGYDELDVHEHLGLSLAEIREFIKLNTRAR